MVRDFTQAKKEEIDKALELIEDREWKPFMAWCSGRAAGFGEWADRLGISSYTRQIDNYQNKILEVNDDTRNQVNATFGGVLEADRGYADIFRRHAETVRAQIRTVQTMLQVMQSANRNGTELRMACSVYPQAGSYEQLLENGQRVLESYLKVRGITNLAEQRQICDLMVERQPSMLINLYISDCNSGTADKIYDLIMNYYSNHKHDKELAAAEGLLDSYLESKGYTNLVERQFIISMIREEREQQLLDLYETNMHSPSSYIEVAEDIERYYTENRENIGLEVIEERFRNDENADQYMVVCGYLELLVDLHYICKAEYDEYVSSMEEQSRINGEMKEEICAFMLRRKEFIKAFEGSKKIAITENGKIVIKEDEMWTREQIVCALQIETELTAIGYDNEFIIGLIGNMKIEGKFGSIEATNLTGYQYWEHINECIDYNNAYSPYKVMDVDLIELYIDMIYKRYNDECENPKLHYFGMGAVQWTDTRGEELLRLYLKEAGYDIESTEFQKIIQNCLVGADYDKVYLTEAQVRNAEMEMIIYELTESKTYKEIYPFYKTECGNDIPTNIEFAAKMLMKKYINPYGDSESERAAAALRWYDERYNND